MLSPSLGYYLGCPVWASPAWVGKVFSADAKRAQWLRQYSAALNTVEGNSTFYGLPSPETIERWADETLPGFRFALKFPQAISHTKALVDAQPETDAFLEILAQLAQADRLGPSFLQLPPQFSRRQQPDLEAYLRGLPREFPYAVEVRHRDWFDAGPSERELDSLLTELGIDRVLLDSRPLFASPATDESEEKAQRQKPRPPLRHTTTGSHPVLRLIGRNQVSELAAWLAEWAAVAAGWIQQGKTPYVFTHAPNDLYAPDAARQFHLELRRHLPGLPELPQWPGERSLPPPVRQGQLF